MKAVISTTTATPRAKSHANYKIGKHYKWQKRAALAALYGGITMGLGGLILLCANYLLRLNFYEIDKYGAVMGLSAFVLIPSAIHALDRIVNNPAD